VFPNTHIQRCIVHMVRNSTRFVSYKDLKQVCADLKAIYRAPSEEALDPEIPDDCSGRRTIGSHDDALGRSL
jgi:transposase-like protein